MLDNLYIENIAVIERCTIDLAPGLNVLTGETGAGKSIIIDSIQAILGSRTSRDLIRSGVETAFVSAAFSGLSEEALHQFSQAGYEPEEDGVFLIQRELSLSGKGKCRINGRPATVGTLKALGEHLIDIHGQHASYELLNPERHVTYIDHLGGLEEEVAAYRKVYQEYTRLKSQLQQAQTDEGERMRRMDLLRYQVDELEQAELVDGEWEELTERERVLANREKIVMGLQEAYGYLNGGEEEDGSLQMLEEAVESLSSLSDVLPEAGTVGERLSGLLYELEDCRSEVLGLAEEMDCDEDDSREVAERLDLLYSLSRKYGSTIREMLDFLEKAKQELEALENYDENREKLMEACRVSGQKAKELAKTLSEKRRKISEEFVRSVKKEMTYLDMPHVELVVRQETCPLNANGCDQIEILISTNPGEQPKPVAKIASGGELSRMMLAIKNVLSEKEDIGTLIFDEVDTGISGSAAQKVGFKLKSVSGGRQVLCVTHLAQIAALADSHLKIAKSVSDGKTFTSVTPLDHEGRRRELARIIGGVQITEATLQYAEEMLQQSAALQEE